MPLRYILINNFRKFFVGKRKSDLTFLTVFFNFSQKLF